MKFLLLIFFACLCLAASADFSPHSFYSDVQFYDDGKDEHFHEELVGADEDVKEDLKKKLKERFDEILEKLKDTLENGKGFREDTIKKLKEIREKLKDLKVDLGDKAKELIEKLKDKAKDYWQKILDRLELKESVSFADDDEEKSLRKRLTELLEEMKSYRDKDQKIPRDILLEVKKIFDTMEQKNIQLTVVDKLIKWAVEYHLKNPHSTVLAALSAEEDDDLARNLRERFEEILEKIKEAIENRKVLGGNVVAKMREIYNQMKEKSIPFGDKVKELLEQMKEKATGLWKRILDKVNPSETSIPARGTGAENLRERLQELLEKLKDSFRDRKLPGKGFISKLRQIRDEMRQKNVPLGGKLRDMIEKMKENTSGVWRRILDRFGNRGPESFDELEFLSEGDDFANNLRERFEELLQKIKDAIENRKLPKGNVAAKLREIYNQMKEKSIPFGDKVKELLEQMKEKATGLWKRILDKINISETSIPARGTGAENLRERLQELLEKLKESFRDRKLPGRGFFTKLRKVRLEMRQKNVPMGGKLRNMIETMKENTSGVWRRILDRFGRRGSDSSDELEILYGTGAENLRERLQELLEKLKESFRDRKLPGKGFISKLRQIRDEMRQKNVPLGGKLRDMIEKMKENTSGVWRRILDRFGNRGPESSDELAILYEDPTAEIGKILNKHLDDILDRLKDIIENGKAYKEDLVEKAKEIAQKLKDMKVDIGDHAINVLKDLKEKAKDYWNKILDRLSFKSESNLQVYMEEPNSELAKALKKHFEEILEKMNDIIENGKTYKDDLIEKAKEIAQKLKDMKVDIGDHARKVLNDLKEKAKDYWNKILDKLSFN